MGRDQEPIPTGQHDVVIDAVYQDGVIKPLTPIDLPPGTPLQLRIAMRITVLTSISDQDSLPALTNGKVGASPYALAPSHNNALPGLTWLKGLGNRSHTPVVSPPLLETEAALVPSVLPDAERGATKAATATPVGTGEIELRYVPPLRVVLVLLSLCCGYAAHTLAGDQALAANPIMALVVWLVGIGLAVAACRHPGSDQDPRSSEPPWSRPEVIGVVALFVFALLVRIINMGTIPAALSGDEGSIGLTAVDIVAGKFTNPFSVGWFSFPSLFFALPALFIGIFGQTYEALRAPAAIAGAVTVVGLYWFARSFFGRTVAASSAALLAALHFHIHFSRLGLNNIWDGLFGVLILGTFWRGWKTGRRSSFLVAGVLIGLSQYFYTSTRLVPLVLMAWLGLILVTNWRLFKQRLPDLLSVALVSVVVFLPLGLFFASHPQEFSAPINRVSLLTRNPPPDNQNWFDHTSHDTGKPVWKLVLENYTTAALGFVSVPLRSWYQPDHALLLVVPAVLFVLGLCLMLQNFRDPRCWLLVLLLFGMISISALTESTPAAQRFVIAAPIATLIAGIGFATIIGMVLRRWPLYRRVVYGLAATAMLAIMAFDLHFYFITYAPQKGQGDVNTQVAAHLGHQLSEYAAGSQVLFFGPPRMGYRSLSTVPFLAPQVQGTDVPDKDATPPDVQLTSPHTLFVFLPERQKEAAAVEQRYPGGTSRWILGFDNTQLYYVYDVAKP